MSSLEAAGVTIEAGGLPVVEGLSLRLGPGDKVGLVGRNGAGKTSTLEVLAGETPPLSGRVVRRGSLGYLRQDLRRHRSADGVSALEQVVEARGLVELGRAVEKARLALEESQTDARVSRFSRLEDEYRRAGGYRAEADARAIAHGLGLSSDRLSLPVSSLSGGERRRLELAGILFAGADLLLLDEPTNHLDVDARTWLLRFLASYRGALVVVSHDLVLLDASITRILHLDDDGVHEYRGTYSQYREARRRDEARRRGIAARQGAEIDRLRSLADSLRGQTVKRARVAKALDSRVARLEAGRVQAPRHERAVTYRLPPPPRSGRTALVVEGLSKSYDGLGVFRDLTFDMPRGDRLLVMGLNGAGKTSLLRILTGGTAADAGTFRFGHGVAVGYYAQEHEGVELGVSVLDHLRAASTADDQSLRRLLGMFGLTGEIAHQDAGTLSGGEKTKLALAQLVAGRRNLLLLDEPTNNLDPPSRAAIAEALRGWLGAMLVVSHDPEFVEALGPHRVLLMPDGTLEHWRPEHLELVELA